jgi:hypothetical protein
MNYNRFYSLNIFNVLVLQWRDHLVQQIWSEQSQTPRSGRGNLGYATTFCPAFLLVCSSIQIGNTDSVQNVLNLVYILPNKQV